MGKSSAAREDMLKRIDRVLDRIRPFLQRDEGNIEVVELTPNNELIVRWKGNCSHCEISEYTTRLAIEQLIREHFPQVKSVIGLKA